MEILGYSCLAMGIFVLDLLIKNRVERTETEGQEEAVCGGRLLLRADRAWWRLCPLS